MRWQAWCIYTRAWWGQKAEMLKKYWFLCVFWGVKRGPRTPTERTNERAGVVFGRKSDQRAGKKKKDEPLDMRWQVWCIYAWAWWGQSKNVEKPLVLNVFLKESKGAIAFQACEKLVDKGGFGRKNDLKMGKRKKKGPLDMRWQAWCIYARAWWGQKAEMLKKCWFL